MDRTFKKDPTTSICCLQKANFRSKDTQAKSKRIEKAINMQMVAKR